MNPYLSGIMALSQLSPEQFDMGMQRFQQIQGMQPQGLSALQAKQSGLTGSMAEQAIPQGPATFGQSTGAYLGEVRDQDGNVVRPAINNEPASQPTNNTIDLLRATGIMSPFSNTQGSFGTGAMPYTQPYYQRSFNPYAGGYGMGFGGGMPSYGGFGGGKGGGRPSYGGGKGGRGY